MCFSATASFVAASVLLCVGIAAISISKSKSHYMLAGIPLLFALQQAFEGIVWITNNNSGHCLFHCMSSHVFLFFAFAVWPIWVPIALFVPEKIKIRRKALIALIGLGVILSAFDIYQLRLYQDNMTIISNHLEYGVGFPERASMYLYLFVYACTTILPCFISSLKLSNIFGFALLGSLIFTQIFMAKGFTSVWCFFAAILSIIILFMVNGKKNY